MIIDNKPRLPELLAPAGNFEKLVTAIHYGADAVYLGGKQFSLRAHATNFSAAELKQAVHYAHSRSVKVYATANIFAHNNDLPGMEEYLLYLRDLAVDGVIISDPGVIMTARQLIPEIPIHLSTQANVTNKASARFWQAQGVTRLNVARELTLAEIAAIKNAIHSEVEVFIHGALCISYSGRCLLSYYLTGRDANQGNCAHPCRYQYKLLEEKRPEQYFPVDEDDRGTYIFNAKDLCLLNRLPDLMEVGVDSLKIEGRMKSTYYVGGVVRVYRAALNYLAGKPAGDKKPLPSVFMEELARVGTRGYTENFIDGPPAAEDMIYKSPRLQQHYAPAGVVRRPTGPDDDSYYIEVKNVIRKGDQVEYLGKRLPAVSFTIKEMRRQTEEPLLQANPGDIVSLKTIPAVITEWEADSLIRKKII